MATIYLSSTFSDLQECRQRVYRALARLKHTVRAMEDYVARDDRPVEACLKDVADCDLYVGLFAHRYGYIVVDAARNPDKLSITELELRTAQALGKSASCSCSTPRPRGFPPLMDSFTRKAKRERALPHCAPTSELDTRVPTSKDLTMSANW